MKSTGIGETQMLKLDKKNREIKGFKRETNLNGTVVLVVVETERTESAVHTIQAIHIAFALV